jgi:hypothetical protein
VVDKQGMSMHSDKAFVRWCLCAAVVSQSLFEQLVVYCDRTNKAILALYPLQFLTPNNCLYMSFIARPYDLIFCAKLSDARDPGTAHKIFKVVPLVVHDDLGVDDAHVIKVVSRST